MPRTAAARLTSTPISPPSIGLFGTEPFRAAFEYAAYRVSRRHLPVAPLSGECHPVIIFPGLATNGAAVAPLRKFCESRGHPAFDWGKGLNTGPSGNLIQWMNELADHTAQLLNSYNAPATLIGWSLGGLYAREVAKLLAPQVRQVITLGTPFNAEADHTRVGSLYRLLNGTKANFDANLSRQLQTPPPVPTTSIYSRSDGIVAWETCCHAFSTRRVEDIEIKSSHIGMGWNPAVLEVIADRLAQKTDTWKPYCRTPHPARSGN